MQAETEFRRIEGDGTLEAQWQAWPGFQQIPACTLQSLVPAGSRAVVVAPHPDDEVLAFGGLLAMLCEALPGNPLWPLPLVVAVTDGEASHPGSALLPPALLVERRTLESQQGLRQLGLAAGQRVRLSIPDGQVRQQQDVLTRHLKTLLQPGDTVFSTWALDGHPDHEASADAVCTAVAALPGVRHWQAPVWMWHWAQPGQPQVPWQRMQRLALSAAAVRRKLDAIAAHTSQLTEQPGTGVPPVLSVTTLQRLMRADEYFVQGQGV